MAREQAARRGRERAGIIGTGEIRSQRQLVNLSPSEENKRRSQGDASQQSDFVELKYYQEKVKNSPRKELNQL